MIQPEIRGASAKPVFHLTHSRQELSRENFSCGNGGAVIISRGQERVKTSYRSSSGTALKVLVRDRDCPIT